MLLQSLVEKLPLLWVNPRWVPAQESLKALSLQQADMLAAAERLERFAPLLEQCFPELEQPQGIIESPLLAVPLLQEQLLDREGCRGKLYIKADHSLPVAGSVKARGGIYEVLVIAEKLAIEAGFITEQDNTCLLNLPEVKAYFSQHTISVGSTGNLGLSIGIIAAALGFQSVVHMSADAKDWKKERLRQHGVSVIEHTGDYASAVAEGRKEADYHPFSHFVDDEHSLPLFLGYSVAALRLQKQLRQAEIPVDEAHPLFVYIPCGVGGAPGGITFGLKHVFGDHVHCFFAEPVDSPCMLVQLAFGEQNGGKAESVSVYDIGLTNKTEADGLAVASASLLVSDLMRTLISGIFTVPDDDLFGYLRLLYEVESIKVEPSATAAFSGPSVLLNSPEGQKYLMKQGLKGKLENASHILWITGGGLMPDIEFCGFLKKGTNNND